VPIRSTIYSWLQDYISKSLPPKFPQYKLERVKKLYTSMTDSLFLVISKRTTAVSYSLDPARAFGEFFLFLNDSELSISSVEASLLEDYHKLIDITVENWLVQEEACNIKRPQSILEIKEGLKNNKMIKKYYLASIFFRTVVLMMNQYISRSSQNTELPFLKSYESFRSVILSRLNFTACTSGEGCSLNFNKMFFALSKESLLCLSDLVHQRMNLYLSCALAEILNLPQYLKTQDLYTILTWGDQIIKLKGQEGYKAIKLLEPCCISSIIEQEEESVCDSKKFFSSILSDFDRASFEYDRITALRYLVDTLSLDHKSQVFGLFRIWGHPVVNSIQGIQKVIKSGCSVTMPDKQLANDILYMFRLLFINGYLEKNKIWPDCDIEPLNSDYLNHCKTNNIKLDPYSPSFKLSDMKKVQINKVFEPDPTYNISSMMSDKALSLKYTELLDTYKKTKGIGKSANRKVILEWLKSEFVSAQELIQEIDSHGMDKENLAIGVVPKEREMKVEPRLFALLTLKTRLYFVITESLIADHLLEYFPQITMGMTGAELNKTLYNITKTQKEQSEGSQSITVNIDFEKWNLKMRKFMSLPLFKEFDRLFGYNNVFQRTHEIFESSFIYLADEETELRYKGGEFLANHCSWKNHFGGFEGQRQKGWTILTVCLIELATMPQKLKHSLVGRGDNQVLVIHINIPHQRVGNSIQYLPATAQHRFKKFKNKFFHLCERARLPTCIKTLCIVFVKLFFIKLSSLSRRSRINIFL
jgi:hypothetical protein